MFWRFGGYAQVSSLDAILDKPDLTVEELLDESDLIQELKQQNSKLIEYLRDENVLERLLRYVIAAKRMASPDEAADEGGAKIDTSSPREGFFGKVAGKARSMSITKTEFPDSEESKEEKQRMKYAYVACEILSSEVWSISEAVLENQDNLRQFWNYLKQPAPLDPVQAGYFTKVNESLLDRKMEEMLGFFKSIDNVVPDMLQHVDCPMVMDLLLKIISLEKSEGGQGIVDVSIGNRFEENIKLITWTVVAIAKPHPQAPRISLARAVLLNPNIRRGFLEGYNHDICQCHNPRPVCHRA
jgi:SIT4-associating protein SAP185/190